LGLGPIYLCYVFALQKIMIEVTSTNVSSSSSQEAKEEEVQKGNLVRLYETSFVLSEQGKFGRQGCCEAVFLLSPLSFASPRLPLAALAQKQAMMQQQSSSSSSAFSGGGIDMMAGEEKTK
jgi:hypothetical protein